MPCQYSRWIFRFRKWILWHLRATERKWPLVNTLVTQRGQWSQYWRKRRQRGRKWHLSPLTKSAKMPPGLLASPCWIKLLLLPSKPLPHSKPNRRNGRDAPRELAIVIPPLHPRDRRGEGQCWQPWWWWWSRLTRFQGGYHERQKLRPTPLVEQQRQLLQLGGRDLW